MSAILSWIRQWKTVASSSKRWMRAAKSGSTVKYYEGLFRNQCQTFISRVNNVDILSNRFGSTRHEERCGFPGVLAQQEGFKPIDPKFNPLYGPLSLRGKQRHLSKFCSIWLFFFFELVLVKTKKDLSSEKFQLTGSLTGRMCPVF